MAGPLSGYRVLEFQGIGPGPFCGMMLADMGADVVRIDRASNVPDLPPSEPPTDVLARGRRSVGIDLKQPLGTELALKLVEGADALIEGFRPGVMERLGLGPDTCLARNSELVYGRMTGWGQDGPYAPWAGHDINYIALAGCLAHIGPADDRPVPPLNLIGDFGGGGMLLAFGIACGLLEAQRSGAGQVIDAAMVDGAALLMAMFHGMRSEVVGEDSCVAKAGFSFDEDHRGANGLDSGAHFYNAYRCSDGKYVSIGSNEPQFYAQLLRIAGLEGDAAFTQQSDRTMWPVLKRRLELVFATKTRDEWCSLMEHTDVCFAPVLTIGEAYDHPHNQARRTFVEVSGLRQPAPAPRFSRTKAQLTLPPAHPGAHSDQVLGEWCSLPEDEIADLRRKDVLR